MKPSERKGRGTNDMGIHPITNISLFSGAGGLDLGADLVGGFRTVCYVEFDGYAQGVLMSRMRDGGLDEAPIWDDVSTFKGRPWRGRVDVISGGFPCQDLSVAGKRAGIIEGKRSGLWKEYARIVDEVRPRFVLVENVPGLLINGALGVVLGDLATLGYDAEWFVLSAAAVGAPHLRERVWVVANAISDSCRRGSAIGPAGIEGWDTTGARRAGVQSQNGEAHSDHSQSSGKALADAAGNRVERCEAIAEKPGEGEALRGIERSGETSGIWTHWNSEPNVGRVANGVAFRVDRLRLCGNGVVPQQSAPAWQKIKDLAARPAK